MMNSLLQNCHLSFYKNSIIILMYRNCYNKVLFDIYVLRDIVLYAADPQLILDTNRRYKECCLKRVGIIMC